MSKRLRIVLVSVILLFTCSFIIMPVSAISINPAPTTLAINRVYVYENCLELGDMLFWADFTVNYAAIPIEPISSTYILRLTDASSVDIRASLPYAYFNNGYSEGLCTIYFSAADVTALGLTWNVDPYFMYLDGNPSANWTGGGTIPSASRWASASFTWKTSTSIGANQLLISSDILVEAGILQRLWNNSSYVLISADGYHLSTVGGTYFTAVIHNAGLIAPSVFLTATEQLGLITTPVQTTPNIAGDFTGSPFDLSDAADALHIGGMWLGIILTLGIIGFCTVSATREVNSYKPFILLTLPLLYVFTRIGWFPILLTIGLGLVSSIGIWYVIWYEKSGA